MKKAFTLAEVLIVLGIVGIVAAITIPSLINAYNRKMLETRFKKTDAVITQAIKMASEELGVDSFEVYNKVPQAEQEATMDLFNSIWEKQFKGATKYYIKDYDIRPNFSSDDLSYDNDIYFRKNNMEEYYLELFKKN